MSTVQKKRGVKKRGKRIVRYERGLDAPVAQRRRLLFDEVACDVLSMALVRWSFTQLVHFSRVVLAVLLHHDALDCDASWASHQLEVECISRGPQLFTRFYADLVENAAGAPLQSPGQECQRRDYYRGLLRACFLVALARDHRVRALVMARHNALQRQGLPCVPTATHSGTAFLLEVEPHIAAFLTHQLSLRLVADQCVQCWRECYMFRDQRARREHTIHSPLINTVETNT